MKMHNKNKTNLHCLWPADVVHLPWLATCVLSARTVRRHCSSTTKSQEHITCQSMFKLKTRWSLMANRWWVCLHQKTFLWPWPLHTWFPKPMNQFVAGVMPECRKYLCISFGSNPFKVSWAIAFTRLPWPLLPDLNLWLHDLENVIGVMWTWLWVTAMSFVKSKSTSKHSVDRREYASQSAYLTIRGLTVTLTLYLLTLQWKFGEVPASGM